MSDLIVPIITSFNERNEIDLVKMRNHADFLLQNGVDFLLLSGTTGLGPSLSYNEKVEVLENFADISDRVIMQVGSLNIDESKSLAKLAKEKKVKAIASLPPYYYPRVPEEWYFRFFKEISEIYPTLAYNFPLTTNYDITPSLVKKINASGGDIIGIKDTTPDLNHMLGFRWEFPNEFKVYCGPDSLILSAMRTGLSGAVPGTGNYIPKLVSLLVKQPDSREGIETQRVVTSIAKISQKYGQWAANYTMVRIINNYDAGLPRPPMYSLTRDQEEALHSDIKKVIKVGD
jgi:2-dehydro-3-deoxy-phosphogluconate/2-dehydro-3-deoxy-6-phosphogalactonate aldolase